MHIKIPTLVGLFPCIKHLGTTYMKQLQSRCLGCFTPPAISLIFVVTILIARNDNGIFAGNNDTTMEDKRAIRWSIMVPAKQVVKMKDIAEILGMSLSDLIRNVCLIDADSAFFGSKKYNDACAFLKNNLSSIETNIRQIESRHNLDFDVWNRYDSFRQAIRERFVNIRLKSTYEIPQTNDGEKKRLFVMLTEDEYNAIKEHKIAMNERLEKPVFVYDVDGSQWKILQQIVKTVGKEVNQIAYLSNAGSVRFERMNDCLKELFDLV